MSKFFSTGDAARMHGIEVWRVRRIFEDGTLPETARFAGKRAIPSETMPKLVEALKARGWLPESTEAAQ